MLRQRHIKLLQLFILTVSISSVVGLVLYTYNDRISQITFDHPDSRPNKYVRPLQDIHGFNFERNHKGKTVISIQADRFRIQKMKLGFFRFGLMNEAKFDNAHIKIFGKRNFSDRRSSNSNHVKKKTITPQKEWNLPGHMERVSSVENKNSSELKFSKAFNKNILPLSHTKKITAVTVAPIDLELCDDKHMVTRITAESAVIRLKEQDIFFSGNVVAESGTIVLFTEHLSMNPDNSIIKTDHPFVLTTSGKIRKGKQFISDIYLKQRML